MTAYRMFSTVFFLLSVILLLLLIEYDDAILCLVHTAHKSTAATVCVRPTPKMCVISVCEREITLPNKYCISTNWKINLILGRDTSFHRRRFYVQWILFILSLFVLVWFGLDQFIFMDVFSFNRKLFSVMLCDRARILLLYTCNNGQVP